jgi:hypothetical protein
MDSSESDNTQFSNYQNRDDQEPADEPKKHTQHGLNRILYPTWPQKRPDAATNQGKDDI